MALSKKAWAFIAVGGVVVVLAAVGGIANAVSPQPESTPDTAATFSASPTPSPTANDLAERVQAALLTELQVDQFTELVGTQSPLWVISEIDNMYPGTIRVLCQEPLTKDEQATIAKQVFSLTSPTIPDLNTVVIRDTTGVDSNHYR